MEGRIKEVLLWPISSLGDIKEAVSNDKNWLALLPVVGAGVAVYATGVHTQPTMALAKTYGIGAVGYMAGLVTYGAIVQNKRKHMKYAPGPMKSKLPPNWQYGPSPIITKKPPTYAPFPGLQPVHQKGHGPVKTPHYAPMPHPTPAHNPDPITTRPIGYGPGPVISRQPPQYGPGPVIEPAPHRDLTFWGDMKRAAIGARQIYNIQHGHSGLSNTPPNWPPGK